MFFDFITLTPLVIIYEYNSKIDQKMFRINVIRVWYHDIHLILVIWDSICQSVPPSVCARPRPRCHSFKCHQALKNNLQIILSNYFLHPFYSQVCKVLHLLYYCNTSVLHPFTCLLVENLLCANKSKLPTCQLVKHKITVEYVVVPVNFIVCQGIKNFCSETYHFKNWWKKAFFISFIKNYFLLSCYLINSFNSMSGVTAGSICAELQ